MFTTAIKHTIKRLLLFFSISQILYQRGMYNSLDSDYTKNEYAEKERNS